MEDSKLKVDAPQTTEPGTSSQKRKLSEDEPLQSLDDEPSTRSRGGRIRKPKVFFDPSDIDPKRRSLPIMDAKRPKKSKPADTIKDEDDTTKIEKEAIPMEKPKTKRLSPSQIRANLINKRRQTISSTTFENGCIVCSRSDINKGRFVSCTDCMKRGHFTCLRTGKLFKTADTEKTWQCPSCKICEVCGNQEPIVSKEISILEKTHNNNKFYLPLQAELFKCITCYNSYHSHCLNLSSKNLVRKRFTCALCTRIEAKHEEKETTTTSTTTEPQPVNSASNDGFAGFSRDESTKKNAVNNQQAKLKKVTIQINANHTDDELSIKMEPKSPSPEAATNGKFTKVATNISKVGRNSSENKIFVRKDLVSRERIQSKDEDDVGDEEDATNEDNKYNKKAAMKPHEDVPDVKQWNCDEVYTYFLGTTTHEFANLLKENQIDGDALLLIKREDVLNRFNLKLGPALRLYSHIVALQFRNTNPILAWNES